MAVTILEALQNAEHNLRPPNAVLPIVRNLGLRQLHNAVTLLEKGYAVTDLVEPLLEEHGGLVENVPEKEGT